MRKLFTHFLVLSLVVTSTCGMTQPESNVISGAEISAYADFTSGIQTSNLSFVDDSNPNYESYTYSTSKGGVTCRHIDNNKYAYFKATNNSITSSDNNLFVEITYFDEGTDGFQLQYNALNNDNYRQATINTSNSNTWITTTVCLEDASFRKAQNGGCDFRIWGRGSKGTSISRLSVTKQSVNPKTEPVVHLNRNTSVSEFKGKSFAGYQGWFGTGGKYNSWQHYANGSADADGTNWPRPNKISIDIYPDVSEYDDSSLAQTGFANLGSGETSKLFDSNTTDVIDTHFRWMREYGIDGAAIQRFVGGLTGRTITKSPTTSQLYRIQRAAENNNRLLYVMYDISGGSQITDTNDTTSISSYVKDMEFDWVYNIEQSIKMLDSNSYATYNGKPVVCVWGFGFGDVENTRPSRRVDYQEIVNFFHDRGCYVILGVPRDWRSQSNYIDIYNQADMISPWYVGALGDEAGVDSVYRYNLEPDLNYCKNNNMDYYPVVFSGFSWTLWLNGKPNMIPRNAGQLFWYQAYKLKQLGVDAFYIAMFDEYDEGTAIAKNASDYFDIPTDQYFVTASCDGYWLSSDYQLRVAGEAVKMVKGERNAVRNVPVAHSLGPIYYRNSFESMYVNCAESQYNGNYPVDPCFKNNTQFFANNVSATTEIKQTNNAKTGNYVASTKGNATSENSSYAYRISETAIKITNGMKLSYSVYPVNNLGKNTSVDLVLSDGTYISSTNQNLLTKQNQTGSWNDVSYTFGTPSLEGKTITGIAIRYDGVAGNFESYFDNIIIEDSDNENNSNNGETYYAGNPVLTSMFTADPSAHVWADGKIYIYASHDIFPSRGCDLMDKYHVFSSDNMVTWKDEGEILSSSDVSWGRPEGGFMWAPDAAYKNGTYYFYFPHPTGSGDLWNSTWRIGVATSNSPASGFTCANDGYIKTVDGSPYVTNIDPCVFKDDDGTYYLYTGGGANCYVAKLKDNMTQLAENPVKIDGSLTDFHEAMWVFKRNGTYYAMYADNTSGQNLMRYSTASSPYGPWREGGIVLNGTGCDTTHGSIAEYKGHWYLFYHNCEISGNGTLRNVCIDEVFFNSDGSIQTVTQTKQGVAAVDNVNPSDLQNSNVNPDTSIFTEKTDYAVSSATISGGATLGNNVIENLHIEGASATWNNINGGKGGKALLTVYYGTPDGATALVHSSGDRTGDGYFMKFNKTTGWGDYSGVSTCFIDLNAGNSNTVQLVCGMGGVNIIGISVSLIDPNYEPPTEKPTETPTEVPTEVPTEAPNVITVSDKLEVNGFQVSRNAEGLRTLYTVEKTINNKSVVERGLIYSLTDYAQDNEMYVGSSNNYVKYFAGTEEFGKQPQLNTTPTSSTYAMTMEFKDNSNGIFTKRMAIRVYAKLSDGSYVYSNIDKLSYFNLCKYLYNNNLSTNYAAHTYIYDNVLKVVDPNYAEIPYDWKNILVNP